MVSKESREIAEYALQREIMLAMANMAIDTGRTEVPSIPPESINMILDMDDNLISNEFYAKHYAPIKVALARQSRELKTRVFFVQRWKENQSDLNAKYIAEGLSVSIASVLSDIVYLESGAEQATAFDIKLKALSQITKLGG